MKSERAFIRELEKKASEQRKIVETEMLPSWARGVGEWLVVHPWRLVIPVSSIVYLILRIVCGERVREMILAIFGGF